MPLQIYESAVAPDGKLAGVFEGDDETSDFYLYDAVNSKVLDAIRVFSGCPDFVQGDIAILWHPDGGWVGLSIRDVVWALFDTAVGVKYGGDYNRSGAPSIPADVLAR